MPSNAIIPSSASYAISDVNAIEEVDAFKPEYFEKYSTFSEQYVKVKDVGGGTDGLVTVYKHKRNAKALVAVKTPRHWTDFCIKAITNEVQNLEIVGNHDHCLSMLASMQGFESNGNLVQAAIVSFCDWGHVNHYQGSYITQQEKAGKPTGMPEVTVLKLLRDLSLGLDHLHNGLGISYVHGDLKTDNILVSDPVGYSGESMCLEPVFKIADFARLKPYPAREGERPHHFPGTRTFAPPKAENYVLRPPADIWCLGATIQQFALNVCPLESIPYLEKRMGMVGRDHHPQFLEEQRVMYRPLHESAEVLRQSWGVQGKDFKRLERHKSYSRFLNVWYKQLFETRQEQRITAVQLVKFAIPMIDMQMPIARRLALAEDCFEKAARLRAQDAARRDGQDNFTIQSKLRSVAYGCGYTDSPDGIVAINA